MQDGPINPLCLQTNTPSSEKKQRKGKAWQTWTALTTSSVTNTVDETHRQPTSKASSSRQRCLQHATASGGHTPGSSPAPPGRFQDVEQPPNGPESLIVKASPELVASPGSWDRRNISGSARIPWLPTFRFPGWRAPSASLHLARAFKSDYQGRIGWPLVDPWRVPVRWETMKGDRDGFTRMTGHATSVALPWSRLALRYSACIFRSFKHMWIPSG